MDNLSTHLIGEYLHAQQAIVAYKRVFMYEKEGATVGERRGREKKDDNVFEPFRPWLSNKSLPPVSKVNANWKRRSEEESLKLFNPVPLNLSTLYGKFKDANFTTFKAKNNQSLNIENEDDLLNRSMESLLINLGKTPAGHVCLFCRKLHVRKYGLKMHLRKHTGFKPLQCNVCFRPYGDPSNLNKHLRMHSKHGLNKLSNYRARNGGADQFHNESIENGFR